MYKIYPKKRYEKTLNLVKTYIPESSTILDLGVENPFTKIMADEGFNVLNTDGTDLDLQPESLKTYSADVVTAFEILEHLVNPFGVLTNLPTHKLLVTVPLQLWFAEPYRKVSDPRDWHYHEFVDWQFDMLLEKAGWQIIHREKWTNPTNKIGIRPLLRKITPRYYAVYAERK